MSIIASLVSFENNDSDTKYSKVVSIRIRFN